MPTAKVQARGQITLPSKSRRKAGIRAGDILHVEVLDSGEIRLKALPRLGPRQLRERYPIDVSIDETRDRAAWQADAAKDVIGRKRAARTR